MTPAEASAILDREHVKFEAQYEPPPPPEGGAWTPLAIAMHRLNAWEAWAVKALEAVGEPIEAEPRPPKPKPDTSDWYARNIAATQRRIERNERAIARWESYPRADTSDARAAINAPLKQRQRGMAGEMKAWRDAEGARRDMAGARSRLAWLQERAARSGLTIL